MSSFDGWRELTKVRRHNYMMTNEMERRWNGQEQGLTALMFSGHWLVSGEVGPQVWVLLYPGLVQHF